MRYYGFLIADNREDFLKNITLLIQKGYAPSGNPQVIEVTEAGIQRKKLSQPMYWTRTELPKEESNDLLTDGGFPGPF